MLKSHYIYKVFNSQTLIIDKDSTLNIDNGHKKEKESTYYILAL